jgi:hypothetical protein
MVSQDAVKHHIAAEVRKADLNTVSARQIRRAVEKQLNLNQDELSSGKWKKFVGSVIGDTMAAIQHGGPEGDESDREVARMSRDEITLTYSEESKAEEDGDTSYSDIIAT